MSALDRISPTLALATLFTACTHMPASTPDVHGHRGCRGVMPENSVPGFIKAVDMGCDYLELDVVLSADDEVIVSHEPWMNSLICLTPDDAAIAPDEEKALNIFRMTTLELQQYDCGSVRHPGFPKQRTMPVSKPTLREVVEAVDEHALLNGHMNPAFNVEIKSHPDWYGVYQPGPDLLAERVVREIDALDMANRCIVQSFDPAVLRAIRAERDDLPLALLVETSEGLDQDLQRLGFQPDIYCPHFSLVTPELAREVHGRGMDLVVWTVNEKEDIRRILQVGVDGIISDHPDRVLKIIEEGE